MGVLGFYSWLTKRYPNIKETVYESKNNHNSSITTPNPNVNCSGLEFDHFYLDMNGIIHPCFHPDFTVFPPTTYEDVFENIYAYIDRLFSIVKPRKLLYLAIDGVAPRAKMDLFIVGNYVDGVDPRAKMNLREEYERKGTNLLPVVESQVDSNVIAPGTEFMFELSKALKSYVIRKLESDPGWKDIKVIISDANFPGEGEHKIMSFIRTLRSLPGYDPNTRHCLYGLDADLIMLALASHEIHFSILREDAKSLPDQKPSSKLILQTANDAALTTVRALDKANDQDTKPFHNREKNQSMSFLPQKYAFVHVWILREYLELDMQIIDPPEKFVFDLERIIDDFIFMCLFMGNDFLPHMPTLEIRENGIGLMMHIYKNEFKTFGGNLVDMQRVNEPHVSFIKLKRVEKFILSVGSYEEMIFKKRSVLRERKLKSIARELAESWKDQVDEGSSDVCTTDGQCPKVSACVEQNGASDSPSSTISNIEELVNNTKAFKEELQSRLRKNSYIFKDGVVLDKVKLGSAGWKQRYYKEKFLAEDSKDIDIETIRKEMVQKYTEGLCWVLMYYFSGVPSWNWCYPYYDFLFASDLKGLSQVIVKFQKGSPFKPFDQLMAVLPPRSAHALPEVYRDLMISCYSSISEFYPTEFEFDRDGRRFLWMGIKLPFIDQEKLRNVTAQLEPKLDMNEAIRNAESDDRLFQRTSNSCPEVMLDYIVQHTGKREEFRRAVDDEESLMCLNFKLPEPCLRAPRLLEGVQIPEKAVYGIRDSPLWHESMGRQPTSRPRFNRPQYSQGKAGTEEWVTHKPAGTGWSCAGRGKGSSVNVSESYSNINIPQNQQSQSSGCATSRGWFKQHPASASGSAPNVNSRMENLRISPSEDRYRGSTRNYNQNGNFWTSRSPDCDQNPSWRPVSYATVGGQQIPAWRPASNANPASPQFTPRGSGRGRGRGYYRPTTDSERLQDPNRW